MEMETDELSDSLEFIKTENEELIEPLLTNSEVSLKIALGEFVLRDYDKKGKVWSVFAKIYTQNFELVPGFVCCKDCGKLLAFRKNNSTSNLVKHKCYVLRFVHRGETRKPEYFKRSLEPNIEIQNSGNSNASFEYKFDDDIDNTKSNLTNLFTNCFIQNCLSYEILQNEDFKAICQKLLLVGAKFGENVDIESIIPNRMAVAKNVNEIYENSFAKVCKEIGGIKGNGFGLACHMGKSFLVLTIHFLNTGKITNRLLGLRPMESDKYSSQNALEILTDILKDYNCELCSTSFIVVSGCRNITEAQTIPCISILLGNILNKTMGEVPETSQLIENCMKLHLFLKMKPIEEIQESFLSSSFLSPSNFLPLFKVLELIANYWEKIEENINLKSKAIMENINKLHLEVIVKTLRPFKDAIESWQDDGHATSYLVIVYLHELKKSCEANDSECKQYNFIKKIKKLLRQNLDKFAAENVTLFHKVALFLYPPANKLLQFDDIEKKNIEVECKRLMSSFKVDLKTNTTYTLQSKRKKLLSDFVHTETNKDLNELIEEELQFYKLTRVLDNEDFDPFIWWAQQQQNFPHLYRLSQMVLSTPATSIAAQRIFASVGELCLNDNDKQQMAFIKFNGEPVELCDLKL